MALTAGTRLGPYQIVTALGAGGMGEVYRARDTRLGREVALKVLPQHLTASPEDRARFKREAKTISSLNHPNICALYDVGLEGDTDYLIMELIEGETLAQRLSRGALPGAEVLKLGSQIADALDRAHRVGVVHRDLKPGNVMLTKGGAKLMDFGLARATGRARSPAGSGATAVASGGSEEPITGKGMVVGTVQYMAPEQLEGKRVDGRSDLWALGCVLYEMSTGKRAFEGTTTASLISAIMRDEPRGMSELAPMTPPSLERLVRGCLVKDPEERVQTAHDAKLQLQWIVEEGSQGGVAAPVAARRRGRVRLVWGWAAAATVAAALLAIDHFANTPAKPTTVVYQMRVPSELTGVSNPEMSPDGRFIAFGATDSAGATNIWVRPLSELTAHPIPGTDGADMPFWSPDGRDLGFFTNGQLKRVALAGGPPQTLCSDVRGAGGTWSRSGVILFDMFGADTIAHVNAAGGAPSAATTLDRSVNQAMHELPQALPDGRHFLFLSHDAPGGEGGVAVMIGDLDSKSVRTVAKGDFMRAEYAPPGYLVFVREQVLMAQALDKRSWRLTGQPFPIAGTRDSDRSIGNFSTSRNGELVYQELAGDSTRLVWVDRTGRELGTIAELAQPTILSLSPDGSRVAIVKDGDIWVIERSRLASRITFAPEYDFSPDWSPDGARIIFLTRRGGTAGLYQKLSSGLGEDELLAAVAMNPSDYSTDGRYIALLKGDPKVSSEIWSLPTSGDFKPKPFLRRPAEFDLRDARLSPDSRWVAYSSMESGRREVYVQAFPGPGGKWQISTQGGRDPQWRGDDKEIFFLSKDGTVMSSELSAAPHFQAGIPRPLFKASPPGTGFVGRNFAVSADGQRFLVQKPLPASTQQPFTVVLHWEADNNAR